MRSSRGALKISAGRALLEDPAVVEEADLGGDVAGEAPSRGWPAPSWCRRRPGRGRSSSTSPDQLGVEGRGDLVEQQQGRAAVHSARTSADPLLLAAREPVGVLVGLVGQAEPLQQLARPRLGLARRRRRAPCAAPACSCRARSGAGRGCRPGRPSPSGCAPRGGRPAGRRSPRPSKRITPSSMSSSRLRQRSSVDLPEPDDPIRQITSCGSTVEVDVARAPPCRRTTCGGSRPRAAARSSRRPARSRSAHPALQPVGEPGQRDRQQRRRSRPPRRTACS